MRKGFWLRGLVGLLTAAIGAAIAWAGYALIAPERAGLKALPSAVALLPFDRRFWALALLLLGASTMLHALPHPFWTRGRRKAAPAPPLAHAPLVDPPLASTDARGEEPPLTFDKVEAETPDAHEAASVTDHHEPNLPAETETPHADPF
jgi:hypothetical protein